MPTNSSLGLRMSPGMPFSLAFDRSVTCTPLDPKDSHPIRLEREEVKPLVGRGMKHSVEACNHACAMRFMRDKSLKGPLHCVQLPKMSSCHQYRLFEEGANEEEVRTCYKGCKKGDAKSCLAQKSNLLRLDVVRSGISYRDPVFCHKQCEVDPKCQVRCDRTSSMFCYLCLVFFFWPVLPLEEWSHDEH